MISQDEATREQQIADYRRCGWTLLRGFVSRLWLPGFLQDIGASPSRRTTVGDRREYWTEYAIDARSSLGQFLSGMSLHAIAEAAANARLKSGPMIWAQSYAVGERISWHRDATGAIQFLLCVQAPDPRSGGALCMRVDGRELQLQLEPGDALLFKATEIAHSTTRLVPSHDEFVPRVTAVARFFADGP